MTDSALPENTDAFDGLQIAPSILAADYTRLGSAVAEVMEAGARVIHVDVMDGHFVPPITIGPLIVSALADQVHSAGGVLDCHLMIERPEAQIDAFVDAGADSVTVHIEATAHAHRTLGAIREAGALAGIAINPGTPAAALRELSDMADIICCMTVNPGWGGQPFIASSPSKVQALRELPGSARIEVDGGIDVNTAASVVEPGATLLVAGSAVFGAAEPGQALQDIAEAAARPQRITV